MALAEQAITAPTMDRSAVRIAATAVAVLFGASAVINLGAVVTGDSLFTQTHFAAAALSLYLLVEAQLYLRRSDVRGLLSPVFLALPFHFFLSYLAGITAAIFEPSIMGRFGYWLPDLDAALASTMLLAMMSAFCMLRGYELARPVARQLGRSFARLPLLRRKILPVFSLAIGLQFTYVAFVAYAINLGAYGLLGTIETRQRYVEIQQFLNLALAAGTLSYFLILLRYFERRAEGNTGLLAAIAVGTMIALHVFTGALSAFKSQIVLPFVIAGLAYFLATKRIPIRFVFLGAAALIAAYAVIEPFRSYLAMRGQIPQDIVEAVEAIGTAIDLREEFTHLNEISQAEAIAQRFDLAGMTSLAVDFVNRGELQFEKRWEFQDSILMAPILAYVPRAVWPDKPSFSPGIWFNQNVRGYWRNESTSVGMGPIGFLYMTGGTAAVLVGFLGFGILQALIFEGIARAGAGGMLIYLSVSGTLVQIPSSLGPAVTGVLRMLPVAFFAQLVLLRRSSRSGGRA